MGGWVHEVDVVGDVDPVQGDVGEQFPHAYFLEVSILLGQKAPVCGYGVDYSCHSNIF